MTAEKSLDEYSDHERMKSKELKEKHIKQEKIEFNLTSASSRTLRVQNNTQNKSPVHLFSKYSSLPVATSSQTACLNFSKNKNLLSTSLTSQTSNCVFPKNKNLSLTASSSKVNAALGGADTTSLPVSSSKGNFEVLIGTNEDMSNESNSKDCEHVDGADDRNGGILPTENDSYHEKLGDGADHTNDILQNQFDFNDEKVVYGADNTNGDKQSVYICNEEVLIESNASRTIPTVEASKTIPILETAEAIPIFDVEGIMTNFRKMSLPMISPIAEEVSKISSMLYDVVSKVENIASRMHSISSQNSATSTNYVRVSSEIAFEELENSLEDNPNAKINYVSIIILLK
jgi:hypothetical protein